MRTTRITIIGIALIVLGIAAFSCQGFVSQAHAEGQNLWAQTPIIAAAMLLATGILLLREESKKAWRKYNAES